jgi:class 3 adenylate cyclase
MPYLHERLDAAATCGRGPSVEETAVPNVSTRNNAVLLDWLRAAAIASLTWGGMAAMQARPWWLSAAVGLAAGAIALGNAELSVLLALAGLCIPILAVNPIVGIIVTVALFTAEHFLGGRKATGFLLLGLALVGAYFGPVWAMAALAGYLLGPVEGGLAAAGSCLAIEALGILTAQPAIGTAITRGPAPAVVAFAHAPASLLTAGWIADSFRSISVAGVNRMFGAFSHIGSPVALIAQPIVWVLAAVVTGMIARRPGPRTTPWVRLIAVACGAAVAWGGDAVMRMGIGTQFLGADSMVALGSSLALALAYVAARETVFSAQTVESPPVPHSISMAAEDADVDELLRLIATAEDKLVSQHTSQRVVLITDMKSFSRMTEEDGSVASAKAIQRHRDLLMPVISANRGSGKSTGGDGVVAAFESASEAIAAAVGGQRALAAHNSSHGNEREILVRMGVASGEVVLDKGGRPFIGTGLNLAARVMNLADGGQILVAGGVATAADSIGAPAHSFGAFRLKNIASPVEITEVLWADGQQPRDPRAAGNDGSS